MSLTPLPISFYSLRIMVIEQAGLQSLTWLRPEPECYVLSVNESRINQDSRDREIRKSKWFGHERSKIDSRITRPLPRRSLQSQGKVAVNKIHLRITVPEKNQASVPIEVDGQSAYTLIRQQNSLHRWLLLEANGKALAKIRASRLYSWIELLNDDQNFTPPGPQLQRTRFLVPGRLDWRFPGWGTIRWSKHSRTMTQLHHSRAILPEIAQMSEVVEFEARGDIRKAVYIVWKQAGPNDSITLPIVISTAFIAMWRWSREVPLLDAAITQIHSCITSWLAENLRTDVYNQLLLPSNDRSVGSHAGNCIQAE